MPEQGSPWLPKATSRRCDQTLQWPNDAGYFELLPILGSIKHAIVGDPGLDNEPAKRLTPFGGRRHSERTRLRTAQRGAAVDLAGTARAENFSWFFRSRQVRRVEGSVLVALGL
ncbi:MAG: hypothetical protein AVDCRST_MAG28-3180 [uncultured Rubrobacteraceae bacterium]|uniref:Uncharacterized protein n=1 Tax=uncultured Rubrobacteraceae bacterium TaxID=349277 RepID=A0A6J4RAM6_9ACTN|nr:MAG: hypothetical protein AVDCRST_MAG28-3180 [uncultured Rubrobacteraceae bacterium]